MKLGFSSHGGVSTLVAGNIPVLWGSNHWNASACLTNNSVVTSQKVIDIMSYDKLRPADTAFGSGAYIPVDIPIWAKQITLSFYDLETDGAGSIVLELANADGVYTGTTYGGTVSTTAANVAWSTLGTAILTSSITERDYRLQGTVTIVATATANLWCLISSVSGTPAYNGLSTGQITTTSTASQLRLALSVVTDNFINGIVSVVYR